jgi:DNA primase
MTLPEDQDPDDVLRDTPDQWQPLVEASIPVVDYYFQVVTKDLDLTEAKAKSEAVRRLAPILSEIRDEVERTHYAQRLSRLIRVDESVIRRQLGAKPSGRRRTGSGTQQPAPAKPITFALEEYCLAVLLRRPELLEQINALLDELSLPTLQEDDFVRIENRTLFSAWLQFEEGQDWQNWVDSLPIELQHHLDFLLTRGPDTDELVGQDAERGMERSALELRHKSIERTSRTVQMLQAEALEQGDARATEYSERVINLTRERLRLERALGERTALAIREREQNS